MVLEWPGGGVGAKVIWEMSAKGDPRNKRDRILNSITDAIARDTLIAEYKPLPDSKTGELAVKFDVVIGATPEDPKQDDGRGGPRRRRPTQ